MVLADASVAFEHCSLRELVTLLQATLQSRNHGSLVYPYCNHCPSLSYMLSINLLFQGMLPLSGINVNRIEDTDNTMNSFEITGNSGSTKEEELKLF